MKQKTQSILFLISAISLAVFLFVEQGTVISGSSAAAFFFVGLLLEVTNRGEFIVILILGGLVFWGYFYVKSMDKVVKKLDSEQIYLKQKTNTDENNL